MYICKCRYIYNVHVSDTNYHVVPQSNTTADSTCTCISRYNIIISTISHTIHMEQYSADSTVSTWLGLISAVQHTYMYNVPLVPRVHILNITDYQYLDHSCHEFSNLIGQQQVHYFPYTPPFAIYEPTRYL